MMMIIILYVKLIVERFYPQGHLKFKVSIVNIIGAS